MEEEAGYSRGVTARRGTGSGSFIDVRSGPVSVRKRDQGSSGKLCQMIISDVLSEGWWLHGHDPEIFRTPLSAPGMVLD